MGSDTFFRMKREHSGFSFWAPEAVHCGQKAECPQLFALTNRGHEVGGGDGPGTIVLPRRGAIDITEVLRWPSCEQEH
jgi:hypothetical protein